MSEYLSHYSVMLKECLQALEDGSKASGSTIFADLTFGAGGHTFALSDHVSGSTVYSTDQDPDALKNGHENIVRRGKQETVKLLPMNFQQFPDWCEQHQMQGKFAGILMDLGVSSHQFDKMERGFSFRADAPLDMRMNCFHAYPAKDRHGKTHPATRTFQALRIAVNDELRVLEHTIPKLLPYLAEGGILAIISFHSLEDRIVKHTFKDLVENQEFPVTILTKKPLTATEEELSENSRSRSAKLRLLKRESQLGRVDGHKKKRYQT